MSDEERLIRDFYAAFARRDAAAMAACYSDDVTFSDPVFPHLEGEAARGMWRMLCGRAPDLEILLGDVEADGARGRAHWEAKYTFSQTGRRVHNRIDAEFEFRDGRIVRHVDRFDLRRWASMALGLKGVLLGWLPAVQGAIRRQAGTALESYLRRSATASGEAAEGR